MKIIILIACVIAGLVYFKPDWLESKVQWLLGEESPEVSIYKAFSEDGQVSFSNTRPSSGEYEVMDINPHVNVIKPLSSSLTAPTGVEPAGTVDSVVPALPFEKARQLLQDAKNVQSLMDQRVEEVERTID